MDMQFIPEGFSEEEIFGLNVNSDDYSIVDGERCGICMDIVIDRGVLDCCQHWFCFTCIDNWATITNLCPLCQNEFQLITCVPVYDTIGSSKTDEDSFSRDDDWCIEGKNNTLSFPSYYIDENAVICLDGDGCKVRSGATTIEEDSNFDTSIACDSCDMWYHALCVGFDTEGNCENSWLCPRCVSNENTEKSDMIPVPRPNNQCDSQNANSECLTDAAFSGKVSVSVADDGETAVVVSMVEGNQGNKGQGQNFLTEMEVSENLKVKTLKSSSSSSNSILETSFNEKGGIEFNLEAQELDLSLPQDASSSLLSVSLGLSGQKTDYANKVMNGSSGFDGVGISSRPLFDESCESNVDLNLGLLVGFSLSVDNLNSDVAAEHEAGGVQQKCVSEDCSLSVPSAAKISPDTMGEAVGSTGSKRKDRDDSDDAWPAAEYAETKAQIEQKARAKKIKAEENSEIIGMEDQTDEPVSDVPEKCQSLVAASRDEKLRSKSEEENVTSIMSIVQGTDRRSSGVSDNSPKERENAAGLRVKKILRRPADDKGSSMLVQTLRQEIREAVRNKSSKEIGENLFDPKLLAAFRAAVAGPISEHSKTSPHLLVKAKKSMLQKGKTRENLTKKIYGISGRRKRAWTRDCEIEFWKHRCLKTTKPEKIETLKSVLNLLRKSPEGTEIKLGIEGEARSSILSRLYLADTSVFPRKDDIKPLSALKATEHPEQNLEHNLTEKISIPSLGNHTMKTLLKNKVSSQSTVVSSGNKGNMSANTLIMKHEASSSKIHRNKCTERPSASSLGDSERNSQKGVIGKPDDVKKDKRKWALAVLARKTAATSRNLSQDKEEDNAVLKGNYPFLAQLPIDMRPILATSRHNKIPISVRQAQLYRLTEHLLRKANLPVICRTAATELAVADAVNIEKEIADRSNSKLVYVNLCSQELLHRSDKIKSGIYAESNPSATTVVPVGPSEQAANDLSAGPAVEEALRNAGLLSDTPPNSPHHQAGEINDDDDLSKISEEGPDNVFEMVSHPDLDIYGDFDYDLEDEDFIGASALKISNLEQGGSQLQVVFSTLNCDKPNNDIDLQDREKKTISDLAKGSSCSSECHADTNNGCLTSEVRTDGCVPRDALLDEEGDEPSQADCEELYGPDKEPLIKRFPELAVVKSHDMIANNMVLGKIGDPGPDQMMRASGLENENHAQNSILTTVGLHSSRIENSPSYPQTIENVPIKEKISDTDIKQSDSCDSVSKKVETYIKEHIRPLCKSGVITVQQYRWAVGKTTEKVMKYHSKEKNANFLIKEGEKVKKLAEQYVEAAKQMENNQV